MAFLHFWVSKNSYLYSTVVDSLFTLSTACNVLPPTLTRLRGIPQLSCISFPRTLFEGLRCKNQLTDYAFMFGAFGLLSMKRQRLQRKYIV